MNFHLIVWRQENKTSKGGFVDYEAKNIPDDASFLEMLDIVNEDLIAREIEPIAFDHDCREGICGACSLVINGNPHGPNAHTTTCQLYMRHFAEGSTIYIEPFRATPFPVLRDLMVDRSSFDRIQQAGGYITIRTGAPADANALPISKVDADKAMEAAACIGCGACVAACPNASAMLFVGAKISHLALLPQGEVEKERRVLGMVEAMDQEGFGNCSNHYECEAVCPENIPASVITRLNREYNAARAKDSVGV